MITIIEGGLDEPAVLGLLQHHFDLCHAVTPPESAHVFDVSKLMDKSVAFFSAWESKNLLAVGAYKNFGDGVGEVKSMHTAAIARRRGVGAMIVDRVMAHARAAGIKRLNLETGSFEFFAPARALYARLGFAECAPFGDYKADPLSTFMTREI